MKLAIKRQFLSPAYWDHGTIGQLNVHACSRLYMDKIYHITLMGHSKVT